MNNKRIAFVHFPHFANNARLETMPFASNSVKALANSGWNVDLFLWEDRIVNYENVFPENVRVIYNKNAPPNAFYSKVFTKIVSEPRILKFRFQKYKKYSCVFGLGQIGSYIASIIAKSSKCPFVYLNDEFPSCWGNSIWAELEQKSAQSATLIVVPDISRFVPLSKELKITSKPHVLLPNIADVSEIVEKINWHERLRIPKNLTPFLHAGSVGDWVQIPEILSSLPYWGEKNALIIHSRSKEKIAKYRQQLSHLENPDKVIWSNEPMSETSLNSLVSYCAGNFALYRNLGPNIEYIGFSSGKLMRSIAYGSPVIASNFSSLNFIKENQLGVLVDHPIDIPNAVKQVSDNRNQFSENCLNFTRTLVSFEKSWIDFCYQLNNICDLNLLKL